MTGAMKMQASENKGAGLAKNMPLDPHRVRSGETLSSIARRSGVSVADLQRWNGIRDANKIQVGQVLYLSEASAFGVSVAFLDALRHPIANLPFRVEVDGRTVVGKTGPNGQIPTQVTKGAQSQVDLWIQDAHNQWQKLVSTASGYGHKLITLVSGAIVVPTTLEPISGEATQAISKKRDVTATANTQAKPPVKPSGVPSKNNPAVTTKTGKGPKGMPTIVIGVDLPEKLVDHFDHFEGGDISTEDWEKVAGRLECEQEVLQAIAKVESSGRRAFWRLADGKGGHVPAILYERHYFSRLTEGQYDKDHPDISWPVGYRKRKLLGKEDKKMHDGKVDDDDIYSSYATSYLRLLNAYRLNPDAALKSCSWGKFQIMGANHGLCGEPSLKAFINKMCTSEAAQIALLAGFIRRKPAVWKDPKNKKLGKEISLWDAVKSKNWRLIAFYYNGPAYETYQYHTKLERAYEEYKKANGAKKA
jgi:LysM repeat protein